jgi:nicotinamidase-related amidase
VLIDLQNGIVSRKLEPLSADQLLEASNALARRFRAEGALVVPVNAAPRTDDTRAVDAPSMLPKTLLAGFIDLVPGVTEPGDLKIT